MGAARRPLKPSRSLKRYPAICKSATGSGPTALMESVMERIFGRQHRMGGRYFARCMSVGSLVALLGFCLMLGAPSSAHEGHDRAPAQDSAPAASLRRLSAFSEFYELVGALRGFRLPLYLDRFQDNVPVTDANISVAINDNTEVAERTPDGTYTLVSGQFGAGGLFEFVFDIRASEGDDLLIGKLSLATVTASEAAPFDPWYVQLLTSLRHGVEDHLMLMSLVLLMGLVLGIGLRRGNPRALPILALAVPVLTLAWSAGAARGHEGHDLSEAVQAVMGTGDSARRLPDGKVFMPKRTQ